MDNFPSRHTVLIFLYEMFKYTRFGDVMSYPFIIKNTPPGSGMEFGFNPLASRVAAAVRVSLGAGVAASGMYLPYRKLQAIKDGTEESSLF
jgi:hypothetical protein